MTATLIRYIRFSLYNSLEIAVLQVWKTWKTQGISFCQICKHPGDDVVERNWLSSCRKNWTRRRRKSACWWVWRWSSNVHQRSSSAERGQSA